MDHILEIDEKNMVAVLESGVTLMQLLEELEKSDGLSFPVPPATKAPKWVVWQPLMPAGPGRSAMG